MLVLDTPVLAALMQNRPDPRVVGWLDAQAPASVWTTTLTVAEVEAGLAQVGDAGEREKLQQAFAAVISDDLSGRVLAFDRAAATAAASLAARERNAQRALRTRDALIAGIVLARRAALVTSDPKRFAHLGVKTLDPWRGGKATAGAGGSLQST